MNKLGNKLKETQGKIVFKHSLGMLSITLNLFYWYVLKFILQLVKYSSFDLK